MYKTTGLHGESAGSDHDEMEWRKTEEIDLFRLRKLNSERLTFNHSRFLYKYMSMGRRDEISRRSHIS